MDVLITLSLSFLLLLFSVFKGYFIAYPLLLSLGLFIAVLIRRGFSLHLLLKMGLASSQKSFSVLSILLLIGAVTAIWMAAGTVPAIVYYGIQLIHPQYFILATFGLTSLVSLLIGTSFGTASTIGIALMIMAKGSGVNPHLIAGAIIAGAYFGDRCSPMSSSANLIAAVTQTKLYTNIKNMWKTAIVPLIISILFYGILSLLNPVQITDQTVLSDITQLFKIDLIDLLPALTILIFSLLQIDVKLSMITSIGVALAIALFHQHYSLIKLLQFMLLGFHLDESTPLQTILLGGGVLSMVKVAIIVIISTAFVGIFVGTRTLQQVERVLERVKSRRDCFLSTCLVGIASAAFGCTQTIAILLTQQLVEKKYAQIIDIAVATDIRTGYRGETPGRGRSPHNPLGFQDSNGCDDSYTCGSRGEEGVAVPHSPSQIGFCSGDPKYKENEKGNYKLALDLENTVVVIAALIPWNIAALVPATILNTDAGFIPYAVYLYLVPLLNLLHLRLSTPPRLNLCN